MKYPKIAETLDKIVYLIGKQGISYRWIQEITRNSGALWNPGHFLQKTHCYPLFKEHIHSSFWKDIFYMSPASENDLTNIVAKSNIQKWLFEEIKERNYRFICANKVTCVYTQ